MFFTTIKAQKRKLQLTLPESFVGRDIEVFVFPVEPIKSEDTGIKKRFSAISLTTKGFHFNREEANER